MSPSELRRLVESSMAGGGFEQRGRSWILTTDELDWVVQLYKKPFSNRFEVDVGISLKRLLVGVRPTLVSDLPISTRVENLPLQVAPVLDRERLDTLPSQVAAAFDLGSPFGDAERAECVTNIMEAFAAFARSVPSERELSGLLRDGELRSAFVSREARVGLESHERPTG